MISVVVPVYNAEKYVRRCIESIRVQTYSDWELLLVDDGSTDNSFSILKEYEKEDKRITAIHQKNAGAGAARNRGLSAVSGEYVVFVDADDYIEKNYFELLSCKKEDIVFIDVNRRDESGKIVVTENLSVLQGKSKDDILRGQMTGKILWGGVRKAVKRSLLEKNYIKYSNHRVGEEAIYSFLIMYYAKSFSFIKTAVYNYEVHSNSLSQSYQEDPWGAVALALREKVKEIGAYEEYGNTLNAFILTAGIVSIRNLASYYKYEEYKNRAIVCFEKVLNEMDKAKKIDFLHMNRKAVILYPLFRLRMFSSLYLISKLQK